MKLELVELGAKRIVELVENEQVDLGIIVLPIQNPLFHVYPFIEEEFNLYIHHEHPLAAKSIVALSELREEPFVLFSKDSLFMIALFMSAFKRVFIQK